MIVAESGGVTTSGRLDEAGDVFVSDRRNRMKLFRNAAMAIGAVLLATLIFANDGSAQKSATEITQCGAVISTPGFYAISASLTSTSNTADCIDIESKGVALSIGTVTISGPGGTSVTAVGIKIFKDANGIQLNLGDATIEGFGIGVEVLGSAISISGAATGATVMNNAAQGILVEDASSVIINNVNSQGNGSSGLELLRASGVIVQGIPPAQTNGGYGVWVHSSSGNQFFNLEVSGNKLSGVYVGESATDRLSAKAKDDKPSDDNVFIGAGSIDNTGGGFVIDRGDSRNVITASVAQGNSLIDAVDENPDCDHNAWIGNDFLTTNAACIH